MSGADHLEMAKAVLSAAIDAATAVAAWGDYTAALMQATKAHVDALSEATILEEQEVSYRSARGYDEDEGESRRVPSAFLKASPAKVIARHEIAEAFRRKTAAETALVEAKSKALGALDHASRLMRLLETQ
jgi:hypothetical protein